MEAVFSLNNGVILHFNLRRGHVFSDQINFLNGHEKFFVNSCVELCKCQQSALTGGLETLCGQVYGAHQWKKVGTYKYSAIISVSCVHPSQYPMFFMA